MSALHKWLRHSFNVIRSLKKGAVGGGVLTLSGVLNNVLKGDKVWNKSWAQLGNVISAHEGVTAWLKGGQTAQECRIAHVLAIVSTVQTTC